MVNTDGRTGIKATKVIKKNYAWNGNVYIASTVHNHLFSPLVCHDIHWDLSSSEKCVFVSVIVQRMPNVMFHLHQQNGQNDPHKETFSIAIESKTWKMWMSLGKLLCQVRLI